MIYSFSVPCYLKIGKKNVINLNTYRNLHYIVNNKAKKRFKELVFDEIKNMPYLADKVHLHFKYYLKDRRAVDLPNIHSVLDKYLLDAIVELNKLDDDNVRHYVSFSAKYMGVDKDNPRCEVEIGKASDFEMNWKNKEGENK